MSLINDALKQVRAESRPPGDIPNQAAQPSPAVPQPRYTRHQVAVVFLYVVASLALLAGGVFGGLYLHNMWSRRSSEATPSESDRSRKPPENTRAGPEQNQRASLADQDSNRTGPKRPIESEKAADAVAVPDAEPLASSQSGPAREAQIAAAEKIEEAHQESVPDEGASAPSPAPSAPAESQAVVRPEEALGGGGDVTLLPTPVTDGAAAPAAGEMTHDIEPAGAKAEPDPEARSQLERHQSPAENAAPVTAVSGGSPAVTAEQQIAEAAPSPSATAADGTPAAEPVQAVPQTELPSAPPELREKYKLSGVLKGEQESLAIINGIFLAEGDELDNGIRIGRMSTTHVEIIVSGRTYRLGLNY